MADSGENKTILVIDDADVIKKSLRLFLEDFGFTVFTCSDGLEGIKLASEYHPNLIFLDLMMPNLNGIKMLEVKRVIPDIQNIPVIVISANTARSNVVAAAEAGAERVITKPLKKEMIIKYIDEILGGSYFTERRKKSISSADQAEIIAQLKKTFLESFAAKKKSITECLMKKESENFKKYMHELKGSGGTIGEDDISALAAEVMDKPLNSASDWAFAEMNFNKILQKIEILKTK